MGSKITAEWARLQTDIEINKIIITQLGMCEEEIKKQVSYGKSECLMFINMIRGTADELRKRGFEVNHLSNQKDGDYYRISW